MKRKRSSGMGWFPQIIKKLRRRFNTRDEQMIPGACAGHVEQVPLGVIDLLQVRVGVS
jgi:hypothetical protein